MQAFELYNSHTFQMFKKLLTLLLLIQASLVFAQQGTITGKIYDDATGEALVGAIVRAVGVPGGAITDLDGSFTMNLDPGTYTFTFNYIGLSENEISNIVIKAGQETIKDVRLVSEIESAVKSNIVVTATRKTNTENALQTMQRKSVNVMDGVSSQAFKRTGDNDAGAAISRVTGISVQGGKHVFVRGLGDRYTKTILNGMIIPGLDPDRNTVQMDVFPTNVLDNIVVYKTFTPDLPGDFTGGLVDIATKAFPSAKTQSFSATLGYNPSMHFNKDFLTYKGGKLDWLAFDDGTRALPKSKSVDLTQKEYDPSWNNPELTTLTKKFGKTLAPTTRLNGPNTRLSYSQGNQFTKDDKTVGYNLALNYSHETEYYEDAYFATFIKAQSKEESELLINRSTEGPIGNTVAAWTVLAGTSYKKANNKYSLSLFSTQNAESRSGLLKQVDYRENPYTMFRNNLEYTQRNVTNLMFSGKHLLDSGKWEVEWKLSPTISVIDEPDIRLTAFEYTDDLVPRYELNEGVGAVASRTYRNLFEQNYNAKVDVEREFKLRNKLTTKLKFGLLETFKMRDFEIRDYRFRVLQESKFTFTGDANQLLADNVIWTPASAGVQDSGIYVSGQPQLNNIFNAKQNIAGVYVMNELPLTNRFKTIYGLRLEQARNYYTGQNQNRQVMQDSLLLNKTSLLPSVNFIYNLTAESNLRLSYTKTVARPSFKELSNAQIVDRISGRTFLGNDSLRQTDITNLDIRLEKYMDRGQVVSISGFYKQFQNPIELVAYSAANPNDFQPRNVGNANVYGVELEAKLLIKSLSDTNYVTTFGSNVTLVKSSVEMTDGEREGRISAARSEEIIGTNRDMVGQSPYILNAFINYTNLKSNFDATLTYNVQGPRLTVVGVARNPDVYEMPFHSLNFKASFGIDKDKKWKGSISANNLLNSDRYFEYVSFGAKNQLFSMLKPQRQISLGISYSL